jgi:hypothetical protein
MSGPLPPRLTTEPPTGSRFARAMAKFSLILPFVVILTCALFFTFYLSHGEARLAPLNILVLLSFLLIFGGVVLGIIALALTKRRASAGVFGMALAGICTNGVLLVLLVAVPIVWRLAIKRGHPMTPQGRLDKALKELAAASREMDRFYALDDAAKESFEVGKVEDARKYAEELMGLLPKYQGNWNCGNAIQDANLVLGRIAVAEGRIEDAKRYLIEAGKSPGSPQMDSFGPNMSLARDLLEKGERDAVLEYFTLCRKFWKMHHGQLDDWTRDVKAGRIPDFGANLVY